MRKPVPVPGIDSPFGYGDLVRHVKTQGLYHFVGVGLDEETKEPRCAYVSVETGRLWYRKPELMFDDRFELVERAS